MRKQIPIILALVISALTLTAQSTRRTKLKASKVAAPHVKVPLATLRDTITDAQTIDTYLEMTDFQKTVSSRTETLMLTNLNNTDTIKSVAIDIDYRTPDGKQLNRRIITLNVDIPPMQTRHASVASWDRQQLFYHINTPPARPSQRTLPFTTALTPVSLTVTRPSDHD